jgi:hypothetical protein
LTGRSNWKTGEEVEKELVKNNFRVPRQPKEKDGNLKYLFSTRTSLLTWVTPNQLNMIADSLCGARNIQLLLVSGWVPTDGLT